MPHPASDVDPAQQLRQRRASVEEVYQAIEALGPEADPGAVATLVSDALEASPLVELAPAGTPVIRVNSIVRTVEHQNHLKTLGFSALSPSAHCRGWAADIEVTWFERFGAAGALREVLLDYLDRGVLNVIDEGRAWHICLSPDHAARYARKD